jgi:hypothetical protein
MALELTEKQAGRLGNIKNPASMRGRRVGYTSKNEPLTVVSYPREIPTLNADTSIIHLSFRPTIKEVCLLLDTCPRLKKIQAPQHVIYGLSETATRAIKFKEIELVEGSVREIKRKRPIII